MGLANMHGLLILSGNDAGLCNLARAADLTIKEAKRVGVPEGEIARLTMAGVT
jgi:hypothetical protein